jgi:hypothetical protein
MSTSIVPTKTDLGRKELNERSKRISQRHRTVLLLVDGKRPLSLVLSLAQQAGASTQYFEELLSLGLAELPEFLKAQVAPAEAPIAEAPIAEPATVEVLAQPAPPAAEPPPARPVKPEPRQDQEPENETRHVRRLGTRKPMTEAGLLPEIALGEPRSLESPVEEAADQPMVLQGRRLLQKVVQIAPPPVRFRVPSRLAKARTVADLGEMVDVIEQCMRRAGHSLVTGEAAAHLGDARELLGLGNTRIYEGGE